MNKCLNCDSDTDNPKFCSRSCAAIFNNKLFPKRTKTANKEDSCMWCGGIIGDGATKYCSMSCHQEYQYHIYINKWKLGIITGTTKCGCSNQVRRYIWEKYSKKCSVCKWSVANPHNGRIYLEIEHIDGDFTNNCEENLTLLCPNCHSLTSTYKALNIGNGKRKLRIK